ncbi:MAG: sigma 54-interacting transcriptional regulator [Firmicutes bacterium]|nr:sigma 54-interacting transcriptional regulator [Bacillota bacterium]
MDFCLYKDAARLALLEQIVDNPYEGVVAVDSEGRIVLINHFYADFLGINLGDVLGRHATEVIPGTRLHIAARTGTPEFFVSMVFHGERMLGVRLPIIKDGQPIGAFGRSQFWTVEQHKEMLKEIDSLKSALDYYKGELKKARGLVYTFDSMVCNSESVHELMAKARKLASTNLPILIMGETGVGKELLAQAIHAESPRCDGPMIKVNCAAIPESLFESELFGYEEGAFTGARKGGRRGRFELADKGTLFLDEIAEMPVPVQAKLLRVLQEGEIEKVGSEKNKRVDVRIVAATNRDLVYLTDEKRFRQDLFYRLGVARFVVPPLRERVEDIPMLVEALLTEICSNLGRTSDMRVRPDAMDIIIRYRWPGNVRELRSVLETSVALHSAGSELTPDDLPQYLKASVEGSGHNVPASLKGSIETLERSMVLQALSSAGGNKAKAARALGIHRSVLYRKLSSFEPE